MSFHNIIVHNSNLALTCYKQTFGKAFDFICPNQSEGRVLTIQDTTTNQQAKSMI